MGEVWSCDCGIKKIAYNIKLKGSIKMDDGKKYCKHCGERIDSDCVVCPKCGKQVEELKAKIRA